MIAVPLTQGCAMLAIDPKTLRQWLRHSDLALQAHPTDARSKCLTMEQVHQLAAGHNRSIQPNVSATLALREEASPLVQPEAATHSTPSDAMQVKTASPSPITFLEEADLIQKLSYLETKVTTLQEQLAQLALELLQEQTLRYEQRLHTLEALIQHTERQEALLPALQTMEGQVQQGERDRQERRFHPAELRARSRVIPLIEYGARGTYVVVCPREGELRLTPDAPE